MFAQNTGEQSRVLVHALNYISHDYQFAVSNGKVISQFEYDEELEFGEAVVKNYHLYSRQWKTEDSAKIGPLVYRLDSLIKTKAPFKEVSELAIEIKNKVIAASGLTITPAQYPNLQNGKIVYSTECARCHGNNGRGDGPEGLALDPKPRNFYDNERMKTISPFGAFNTIRLGIEGTGMQAHPMLDDEQVWDVAFYILSLRYLPLSQQVTDKEGVKKVIDSISLPQIAISSDEDLLPVLASADTTQQKNLLAAIRLQQEATDESEFINTSLKYLDGAMSLYQQGKYNEASQLAALAYLEGIEPVENQLKATDPALMERLEGQMQRLRKMMDENRPALEVKDSLKAVRATVAGLHEVLHKKDYSFWLAFLMAASVLLREGLEAFLVILVILSILKATELKNYKLWIHSGWVGAVLVGIALWLFGGALLKEQTRHVELIEGVISFIAVLMLLYVGFWLHSNSEIGKWKEYVNQLVKGAAKQKSVAGLAGLSFFVVFREVFESVLFLSALNIESGGKQSNAIGLGVVAAFAVVIVLAWLVLKFSAKLPIAKLFKVSSLVMGVLAVVLTGKGVHSFQVLNYIPVHGIPFFRFELLGIFPTLETCVAQVIVLLLVALMWKLTIGGKKKQA
ncbi:MAG TPA: FTR1 family protein [Chitinophagales bacterium]|nr:FTR1 family protein [Chitinophagales bacterium]